MEVPSHRACAFCRSQKVRCMMDEENSEVCKRCNNAGRTCIFMPVQKRKQRKRTDTRVAELEREMMAMRSMLKETQQVENAEHVSQKAAPPAKAAGLWYKENSADAQRYEAYDGQQPDDRRTMQAGQSVQSTRPRPSLRLDKQPDRPQHEISDVVGRGLLSMATARQLFETYRNDLFLHYPMVYIPESVSADVLRNTKPMLFLAVLAAAAGKGNPELSATLDKEVLHAYATKSLVHSEKSLELVQALLLSSVWYYPPNKFGQLKYYEYIHMAATMALDIGIGTRPTGQRSRFGKQQQPRGRPAVGAGTPSMHPLEDAMDPDLSMTPRSRDSSPDTGNVESRRTFLACFVSCALVSMSLRRPNMLRATSYIRECVDYIERSRDAVPSDRTVVAWVKLIMIQDEIGTSFAYDDPGGIASITELRTQLMLKDFRRKLTDWWMSTPAVDMTGSLIITYYTTRLYLHEIALHVDHSPEDFKAPYQMGVIEPCQSDDEIPSHVVAEAIAECIHCAHSLLNTFLAMSPESLRALPVFSFVRVSFAAFILAKLCLSAAHPDSRIGQVLDRNSLKAEHFLEKAIHHVREVVGSVRSRVPAIFLALLFKLRAWCLHPEMIEWPAEHQNQKHSGSQEKAQQQVFQHAPVGKPSAFNAPRVVEQGSGNEELLLFSGHKTLLGTLDTAGAEPSGPTPQSISTSTDYQQHSQDPLMRPLGAGATVGSAFTISQESAAMNDGNEAMQLDDQGCLQYFGDMNGLAEGGLTGLDDWGSLPMDTMGFNDNFGYEFSADDIPAGGGGVS